MNTDRTGLYAALQGRSDFRAGHSLTQNPYLPD